VKNLGGRPTKARQMTYEVINTAIQSTQSMSQAAIYAGVSLNTFKKYAKQHGLWAPLPSSKGIVRSVNSQFTKDIKSILEGKSPNPYREQTLLSKAIKEGYIACKCSNCSQDFTDYQMRKDPPLILDFLDKNPQNTKIENLRALCFNCVYSLYYTLKGWYRHRDTAIRQAMDAAEPQMPDESEVIEDSQFSDIYTIRRVPKIFKKLKKKLDIVINYL
jgi:hypothetical protein